MTRVAVKPELIEWACRRSGIDVGKLEARFTGLPLWRTGEKMPTMKQLEEFAAATLTPLGALLLTEPPMETLPVPDFRTVGSRSVRRITAPLIETILQMQRRQDWLREYLEETGAEPLAFVGSAAGVADPVRVASQVRQALGIGPGWAARHRNWEAALTGLRQAAERLRIVVVINGCVGNNTSHPLDPEDFRGFVLPDRMAPLVFVNGADAKAAQMFTLAHELAHLWTGAGAVVGLDRLEPSASAAEAHCNRIAAELLVPARELREVWPEASLATNPLGEVSRRFRVSVLVAARRALDLGLIGKAQFADVWSRTSQRTKGDRQGGDFYNSQNTRVGRVFGEMVVRAAREGTLQYQEAYRLTGLHGKSFEEYSTRLAGAPR